MAKKRYLGIYPTKKLTSERLLESLKAYGVKSKESIGKEASNLFFRGYRGSYTRLLLRRTKETELTTHRVSKRKLAEQLGLGFVPY